jgi:hypothetical protein
MRLIAAIEDPAVVGRIVARFGRPGARAEPGRGPAASVPAAEQQALPHVRL